MSARVEGSSLFSPDGRPPLHVAADLLVSGATGASKVCHIFEMLLKNRADPNSRSGPLDETPLQVVLRQGEAEARIDAARVLLDYGADPNMTDNCGEGPLFEATCNGDEKACQLLLKYGAKPAGVGGPGADAAARAQPRLAEGERTELGKERPATEVPQNAVLSMKYVRAQGKEWALKKLSPACRGDNGGSDQSTDGDCSAALSSSDDDADFRKGCKAPTIRAITSYLMSDEETCVNVYLKLEELFEGASEVFVDEGAFEMQVSAEHLIVRAHGPTSREGSDEVCWELSAPLPAAVDAEHAGLRLRRGRLTAKLPKAAGLPRRLSAEEEARAEAQGLVPEAAPVKASRPGRGAAQRQGAPQACEAQVAARVAVEEAVRAYGGLGAPATQDGSIFRRKAFPWRTSEFSALAPGMHFRRQEVRAELAQDLHIGLQGGKSTPDIAKGREPGGEEARLCGHCRLPVGDLAYVAEGQEPSYLHGECIAQLRVLDLQKEDKARLREAAELKKKRRAKYDIGWKADRIPRSMGPASKLGLGFVPQGMCCLVYDKESHSIGVLPTLDPMGSVNLEYLSLALQVRFSEGREPAFSLDLATEALGEPEARVQRKRFDPEWLAGTSAGEVMFQADYHLKELSMGEYEQPVLGMRSCFDYSEAEGRSSEWRAREWFVVRSAEVNLTDCSVLVPSVKMGVEAREQIRGESGLEDVPITRRDHPLVKYAEAFTHNFDLIAERKSVIYHLRELAKATVLAKFIVDADLNLDEAWLELADQAKEPGFKEIPQLWNERAYSQICVQDGTLLHQEKGDGRGSMYGVYGGVQFGVDRFQLSRPARIAPPTASGMVVAKPSAVSFGLERFRIAPKRRVRPESVSAPVAVSVPSVVESAPPSVVESRPPEEVPSVVRSSRPRSAVSAVTRVSRPSAVRPVEPMPAQPLTAIVQSRLVQRAALVQRPGIFVRPGLQGVDLALGKFNLSEAGHVEGVKGSWGADLDSVDACVAIGGAFWNGLSSGGASAFTDEDKALLKDIFNPHLSDRREEGDAFVPPDKSPACIRVLRELLDEEAAVRKQRIQHFLSKEFVMEEPGPLFPSSWKSTIGIARKPVPEKARGALQARPDYKAEARMFGEVLQSVAPAFDRSTEDGIRFRIYRLGSLEVRTTQAPDGSEAVGAVFSVRSSAQGAHAARPHERLVKVTQYVEGAGAPRCHYYVVLESEQGNAILTEKLADGTVAWEENPKDLEDRSSLAKVLRSVDCCGAGATVGDLQGYRAGSAHRGASGKRYADGAYARAAGRCEN